MSVVTAAARVVPTHPTGRSSKGAVVGVAGLVVTVMSDRLPRVRVARRPPDSSGLGLRQKLDASVGDMSQRSSDDPSIVFAVLRNGFATFVDKSRDVVPKTRSSRSRCRSALQQ